MVMGRVHFSLEEVEERGVCLLSALGELNFECRTEFKEKTRKLLRSNQPKLVIDLTKTLRLFSLYLGTIVDVQQQAKQKQKSLSVLVNPQIAELFKQAEVDKIVNIVVIKKRK